MSLLKYNLSAIPINISSTKRNTHLNAHIYLKRTSNKVDIGLLHTIHGSNVNIKIVISSHCIKQLQLRSKQRSSPTPVRAALFALKEHIADIEQLVISSSIHNQHHQEYHVAIVFNWGTQRLWHHFPPLLPSFNSTDRFLSSSRPSSSLWFTSKGTTTKEVVCVFPDFSSPFFLVLFMHAPLHQPAVWMPS